MKKAVVLLSGGLDSTVTLAYALSTGREMIPVSFRYGQRHSRELEAAQAVARYYGLKNHVIIDLDLSAFRKSALTADEVQVPKRDSVKEIREGIPVTYVPARNIIFLSIAAGIAETEEAGEIFIGANSIDYSGYPDCRPEFFDAFEVALRKGTKAGIEGRGMKIMHPILRMTKAEIVRLGIELKAPLRLTWSCYEGGIKACGRCDSCLLRLKGFQEAGFKDEIEYEVNR
ncbi:MAG: 7-cyano-7-deazaguanine synthase QueC [Methanomassiliicoccales archaeon]|nr:7-cyano-7-deazaguanine synthase QueC [Methanomassiliicoccales archaeon]